MSCSMTQCFYAVSLAGVSGEAQTSDPSIPSLALYVRVNIYQSIIFRTQHSASIEYQTSDRSTPSLVPPSSIKPVTLQSQV